MKPFVLTLAVFASCIASATRGAKADEQPKKNDNADVYELRVYMGGLFFKQDKPQIQTQIKVGSLFFAKSDNSLLLDSKNGTDDSKKSRMLYVVSGVLHPPEGNKFPLDYTFLLWGSPQFNSTYGPNTDYIELGKPFSHFGSDGIVRGFTAILSKVDASSTTGQTRSYIQRSSTKTVNKK